MPADFLLSSTLFFFSLFVDHRELHVLTPSFPTRRSSELVVPLAPKPTGTVASIEAVGFGMHHWEAVSFEVPACDDIPSEQLAERLDTAFDVDQLLVPLVRSEEHTSELQSLMRISYAVFCLKKKKKIKHK